MKILKFNFIYFFLALISLSILSCEEDVTKGGSLKNYVGMAETKKTISIYPDETVSVESKIFATNVSNVDRTFNLVVGSDTNHDSNYYSVPATVTIPAGEKIGVFNVGITGTNLGSGKKIIIGLEQIPGTDIAVTNVTTNGGTDPSTAYQVVSFETQQITLNLEEKCDYNKVVLSIKFDNYPEETAWELYDSSNNVVASGGLSEDGTTITGYADLGFADQSTFTTNLCLQSGTYTFVIYDDYGDGMYTSASVQGNYSLKLGSTVLASGSGNFGSFQDTTFTLP